MKQTKELQTTKEILNLLIINKSMRTPEMFEAFLESNPTAEDFVKLLKRCKHARIIDKIFTAFMELNPTAKNIIQVLRYNCQNYSLKLYQLFMDANPTAEDIKWGLLNVYFYEEQTTELLKLYAKLNSSNTEELEKMCRNFPELRKYLSLATIDTCECGKKLIEFGRDYEDLYYCKFCNTYYDEGGKIELIECLSFGQSMEQAILDGKIKGKFEATVSVNEGEIEFYAIGKTYEEAWNKSMKQYYSARDDLYSKPYGIKLYNTRVKSVSLGMEINGHFWGNEEIV
jgi:hypothetical protein